MSHSNSEKGTHVKKAHLGGKYVPTYFMDYYLVPFAAKILERNPKLDENLLPKQRNQTKMLLA